MAGQLCVLIKDALHAPPATVHAEFVKVMLCFTEGTDEAGAGAGMSFAVAGMVAYGYFASQKRSKSDGGGPPAGSGKVVGLQVRPMLE